VEREPATLKKDDIDVGKQPSWDFGVRVICIGKRKAILGTRSLENRYRLSNLLNPWIPV
jgi:hypothetical protein